MDAIRYRPRLACGRFNAKKRGLSWELTVDQYRELISKDCVYCGCSLYWQTGCSLDRIDNAKGYTMDNVLPCCNFCNKLRSNLLTVDETRVAVMAVREHRAKTVTLELRKEAEARRGH